MLVGGAEGAGAGAVFDCSLPIAGGGFGADDESGLQLAFGGLAADGGTMTSSPRTKMSIAAPGASLSLAQPGQEALGMGIASPDGLYWSWLHWSSRVSANSGRLLHLS